MEHDKIIKKKTFLKAMTLVFVSYRQNEFYLIFHNSSVEPVINNLEDDDDDYDDE